MERPTTTRRRHRRRLLALTPLAALALVVAACGPAPSPPPPPANGPDLSIFVSSARAEIGSDATYEVTVSSVGTQDTAGTVTTTVVAPPGQTVSTAAGSGWTCSVVPESATCTNPSAVPAATSLPPISVTTAVGGAPYAASLYGTVQVPGDVNPANDTGRGRSTVVPPFGPDQLFIQLAGSLNLRSGGNVSAGDVTITSDFLGPRTMVIDATVGTTQVTADLSRRAATLFAGPVTITDPSLQGGTPLTVEWRGALRDPGASRSAT